MTRAVKILFAILVILATPLRAEERVVVVELFTSQGCSSCPPADALLHDLAKRSDVIALSLHVDYWDYIGWKDRFADPAHAKRQKAYASAGGRRMIYTPQMIVNGSDSIVGVKPMKINDLIRAHQKTALTALLDIKRDTAKAVTIRVSPTDARLSEAVDIHLMRFAPLRSVDITRGENAGRKFDYVNVVDKWTVIGQWDGQTNGEFRIELDGEQPGVILIQGQNAGKIHAAMRIP